MREKALLGEENHNNEMQAKEEEMQKYIEDLEVARQSESSLKLEIKTLEQMAEEVRNGPMQSQSTQTDSWLPPRTPAVASSLQV